VPRGSGVALAVGALVALSFADDLNGWPGSALAVGAGGLAILGLVEDVRGVAPAPRFIAQTILAATTLPFVLDDATGSMAWRILFAAGIVVWIVGFVNAFNFMDGINGISAAQTVVAGGAYVLLGALRNVPALTAGGAIAMGVAIAFLPFNLPRARVFLGDTGSYFLGAWLSLLVVLGLRAHVPPEALVAPLAIYLADTSATLIRRVRRGEPWWEPHRTHAYQRLVVSGWTHPATTAFVAFSAALCAALGAFVTADSIAVRSAADVAVVLVSAGYLAVPRLVERRLPATP
jgi:UDP-N-acetylmuramyl pentapeptide phosphotransferase/UDP-N-acetylglucosamine-1-phosphate transferase